MNMNFTMRPENEALLDKVIVTVQDHGNTSAASIPLALAVGVGLSHCMA